MDYSMMMDKSLLDIYQECDRELALAEEELHRTEQLLAELNKQKEEK